MCTAASAVAAPPPDNEEAQRVVELVSHLNINSSKGAGAMMAQAAMEMLGTPYTAGLLDPEGPETLRIPFFETDCMIFVETCLAAVLTAKDDSPSYEKLLENVRRIRYRAPEVEAASGKDLHPVSYETRLHYATGWIRNLVKEGIAEDLTMDTGGVRSSTKLDFMSRNYKKYRQMAAADTDPEAAARLEAVSNMEKSLNEEAMTYIPKALIHAIDGEIMDGDIIFFTTSTAGLDVSHMAIAYRHDGVAGFIHASSNAGEVILDDNSISDYALSRKTCTGIKIVRVKD